MSKAFCISIIDAAIPHLGVIRGVAIVRREHLLLIDSEEVVARMDVAAFARVARLLKSPAMSPAIVSGLYGNTSCRKLCAI